MATEDIYVGSALRIDFTFLDRLPDGTRVAFTRAPPDGSAPCRLFVMTVPAGTERPVGRRFDGAGDVCPRPRIFVSPHTPYPCGSASPTSSLGGTAFLVRPSSRLS